MSGQRINFGKKIELGAGEIGAVYDMYFGTDKVPSDEWIGDDEIGITNQVVAAHGEGNFTEESAAGEMELLHFKRAAIARCRIRVYRWRTTTTFDDILNLNRRVLYASSSFLRWGRHVKRCCSAQFTSRIHRVLES